MGNLFPDWWCGVQLSELSRTVEGFKAIEQREFRYLESYQALRKREC